jgi:exodeoxyribonuclease VII small subunit
MGFETDVKRMEEIVEQLRKNDTSLDTAIQLFEEGVRIASRVDEELTEMERKVEILLTPPDSDGEAELAPFEAKR